MLNSKYRTGISIMLCVIAVFCITFLGKVKSNTLGSNSSGILNDMSFSNVFELSNGDKLAIGNAPYDANMISIRFDSKGNVLWERAFGVYESNSSMTNVKVTENTDGSINIKGTFSNIPENIDNTVCVELTLSADGKLLRTDMVSAN
jgi:hypothetical protein